MKEVTEVIPEGHDLGSNGCRKVQNGDWAAVGVSGGDVATPKFILDGNSVEAMVTGYQGKGFEEEGSSNRLVAAGLQRGFKSFVGQTRPINYRRKYV